MKVSTTLGSKEKPPSKKKIEDVTELLYTVSKTS